MTGRDVWGYVMLERAELSTEGSCIALLLSNFLKKKDLRFEKNSSVFSMLLLMRESRRSSPISFLY